MAELTLPTEAQLADLLESLREGFQLALAMHQAGITPEQIAALGPDFQVELQEAFEVGTAQLDKQATALALAGVSSPLLSFLLRSRHHKYKDDAKIALGVGVNVGDRDGRSRPTLSNARSELVEKLDQVAERMFLSAGAIFGPERDDTGGHPSESDAAGSPASDLVAGQDDSGEPLADAPDAAEPPATERGRSEVEEVVLARGHWFPNDA